MKEADTNTGSSGVGQGALPVVDTGESATVEQAALQGRKGTPSLAGVRALRSLGPQYDEDQHGTYLGLLVHAIADPKNRNIALSGRYGTGKSSVLDQFEARHKNATVRLAISTLAPDSDGTSLTNRIQKEVLKQLVYSARPRTLRHSRFSRRVPLPWWRSVGESAVAVTVVGALLALLGLLPSVAGTGSGHSVLQRIVGWVAVTVLVVVVIAVLRMSTYNRLVVSNVSAAGATLSLTSPTNTYFDEYLDEIVYFFDQEAKDFVIFEDIDRYGDPLIFQALRELNILLNNTPKRRRMVERHQKPLRFIYAVRDSLFESLGEDTAKEADDAVRAETIRANRTKFFEVVIPVVPFISHRTAREHLNRILQEANVIDIDRSLIELVARNATDMRLLLNMTNEYLVFAERLLGTDKVAPEMSPSHLFALVAYKNFHLEDFENISRRSSALDRLYDFHRALVSKGILEREAAKRQLLEGNARPAGIVPHAVRCGKRLMAMVAIMRDNIPNFGNYPELGFTVGSEQYDAENATLPGFWEAVTAAEAITIMGRQTQYSGYVGIMTLTKEHLEGLFPEAFESWWQERNADAVRRQRDQLEKEIQELRGCDFKDLANSEKYTLTVEKETLAVPEPGDASTTDGATQTTALTFGTLVHRTLRSELARELVRHGHVDRNFSLYAAQFYGDFSGADVATFIVQTVQTNSMDINYQFSSRGAFENLLNETDDDFTRTISAYNVQFVDYLLANLGDRADEVVEHLTAHCGPDAQQFLSAFFTSGARRLELAAKLSRQGWTRVFTYLVSDEGVPADVRATLVDAALRNADPQCSYDLTPECGEFIVEHYTEMSIFVQPLAADERNAVLGLLRRAAVSLPDLLGVHDGLRDLMVDERMYELTANNLRVALGTTGEVALDDLRARDVVYQFCLTHVTAYLDVVEADNRTASAVRTSETLIDALTVLASADTEAEDVDRLNHAASKSSRIDRLRDAPASAWTALAAARLFRASLENLAVYRATVGTIDEHLGQLLIEAGTLRMDGASTTPQSDAAGASDDTPDAPPDAMAEAVAVLNASKVIPLPEDRVGLVGTLELEELIPATEVHAEPDNLFALLIKHELVADDATTFAHLREAGWTSVKAAALASNNVEHFLTPALLSGMVRNVFTDPAVSRKLGKTVLASLDQYVPSEDPQALGSAARFAAAGDTPLPVAQIHRIAGAVKDPAIIVRLLQFADANPDDIVSVLYELGGKYAFPTTWEQDRFEVPDESAHETVFKRLQTAGLVKMTKRRNVRVIARP